MKVLFKIRAFISEKKQTKELESKNNIIIKDNTKTNYNKLLCRNLKQLEFVSHFELYLQEKSSKKSSLDFLKKLDQIKLEAQVNTITTARLISKYSA